MKQYIRILTVILLIQGNQILSAENLPTGKAINTKPTIRLGLITGYNNGFGIGIQTVFSDFAQGFPMSVRIGTGMSFLDPGSATEARAIFINGNTNGTPEESGRIIDARLDFLYNLKSLTYIKPYIGVHYSNFKGNFAFIGGNEDFDVTTSSWGIGAGFDGNFPISNKLEFTLSIGSGYYFPNTLKGHDTSYSPDGDNINPRQDYTYSDADNAINQSKIELRFMGGFNYKL